MDVQSPQHVRGIDSLRFVAALWVAFGHGAALPVKELLSGAGAIGKFLTAANGVMYCGPAAVTVFFVISGFCIHLPYVGARRVPIREFYARRFIRIGGPLLAVLALAQVWPAPVGAAKDVLWSVYCELAYYTLYPLLFVWMRKSALPLMIGFSTIVAVALICVHWDYMRHWEFGVLTFIVGYPAWLLGCLLAESVPKSHALQLQGSIWFWRAGAWIFSVLAMMLVYHSPIKVGYPATMLAFSFLCFFWLQQELLRWQVRTPLRWLEDAGKWSFSLYLVHKIVIAEVADLSLSLPVLLIWLTEFIGVLGLSYLFFRVVERPCHTAARRWGRALRQMALDASGA